MVICCRRPPLEINVGEETDIQIKRLPLENWMNPCSVNAMELQWSGVEEREPSCRLFEKWWLKKPGGLSQRKEQRMQKKYLLHYSECSCTICCERGWLYYPVNTVNYPWLPRMAVLFAFTQKDPLLGSKVRVALELRCHFGFDWNSFWKHYKSLGNRKVDFFLVGPW